jgi:hypothetical protein
LRLDFARVIQFEFWYILCWVLTGHSGSTWRRDTGRVVELCSGALLVGVDISLATDGVLGVQWASGLPATGELVQD